jgi:hypothetical protein
MPGKQGVFSDLIADHASKRSVGTMTARRRKPSPISRIVRRSSGVYLGRLQFRQSTVAAWRCGKPLGEFHSTQAAVWAIRKDARR